MSRGRKEASEGRGVDEDNESFGSRGRVVFSGKACAGVDNRLADGLTRWKEGEILENLNAECPGIDW